MVGMITKLAGSAIMSMASALMTEEMLKWVIMWSVKKLVASTENKWDDELVEKMEEQWSK